MTTNQKATLGGVVTYLQTTVVVPAARVALTNPATELPGVPVSAGAPEPWAEVELRVSACPPGDPDAMDYPAGKGVTTGHALRMVTLAHSTQVLTDRVPEIGLSCYTTYSPVNARELLEHALRQDGTPLPQPRMAPQGVLSMKVTRTPAGYAISVESRRHAESADRKYIARGPDVATAVGDAPHWVYQGYPLNPLPGEGDTTGTTGTPQQQVVPTTPASGGYYRATGLRYATGWVLRWPLAYTVVALGVAAALGAGAHAWLHGLYAEELLTILRGLVVGATGGTACKYAGVLLMHGLQGVVDTIRNGEG